MDALSLKVDVEYVPKQGRKLKPTLRFKKFDRSGQELSLLERI